MNIDQSIFSELVQHLIVQIKMQPEWDIRHRHLENREKGELEVTVMLFVPGASESEVFKTTFDMHTTMLRYGCDRAMLPTFERYLQIKGLISTPSYYSEDDIKALMYQQFSSPMDNSGFDEQVKSEEPIKKYGMGW